MDRLRDLLTRLEFYDQNHEFLYGIVVAVLLYLLLKFAIWACMTRKCPGIPLHGEHGQLFITSQAVQDFVIRILADITEVEILRCTLLEARGGYSLQVSLRILHDSSMPELRKRIEQRILKQITERLGVDNVVQINLTLKDLSANERHIAKQQRKGMKDFVPPEPQKQTS